MEQTAETQSTPIPPSDNANTYLDPPQSITGPKTQLNSTVYLSPMPEPNYGFPNLQSLDAPSAFDSSVFDPSAFDPSTFDPPTFDPSTFDPSTFGDPTFDLGRRAELETQQLGSGLFWNPWEESADGPQDSGQFGARLVPYVSLTYHAQPCTALVHQVCRLNQVHRSSRACKLNQ